MTVKELKECLAEFPDDLIVMIPNIGWTPENNQAEIVKAMNVSRGVNEYDGCVFIDNYEE